MSHQPPNGDIDGEGSEDKSDENGGDRPGLSSLPCDPDGEAHLPDTPGTPGTPATEEEWEEVEARASNSGYVHNSFFFFFFCEDNLHPVYMAFCQYGLEGTS